MFWKVFVKPCFLWYLWRISGWYFWKYCSRTSKFQGRGDWFGLFFFHFQRKYLNIIWRTWRHSENYCSQYFEGVFTLKIWSLLCRKWHKRNTIAYLFVRYLCWNLLLLLLLYIENAWFFMNFYKNFFRPKSTTIYLGIRVV